MPKIKFRSNARPSVYGYPEPLLPPKKEEKEKVSTAILSITAKAKARQKKEQKEESMDVVRLSLFCCLKKTFENFSWYNDIYGRVFCCNLAVKKQFSQTQKDY